MKLSDQQSVQILVNERKELVSSMELVKGNGLGVTIQGRYQDDTMLDRARPSVLAELQRRINVIDNNLTDYGVEIDT